MSEKLARIVEAESRLKTLLNPTIEGERVALPDNASETDRLVGEALYRLSKLEAQNTFLLKIIWRTSALVVGTVLAGPAKDWFDIILKGLGV